MNLNYNLWYVKWFFWNLQVLDHFCKSASNLEYNSSLDKYDHGTNLCHFFRTLVLGTIIAILTGVLYAWLVFVIFILPFILFSIHGIFSIVVLIVGIIVAVSCFVALLVGIVKGSGYIYNTILNKMENSPKKNPGFFSMVCSYIVATKQKFCPMIKFGEEK